MDEPLLHTLTEAEFGARVEPYRRELRAHGYRLLGSLADAEDLVQDTLLRAWRRRETFAGRAPLRAWLYKIATNLALDLLKQRRRRTLPAARQAAAGADDPIPADLNEPIWLEPCPDDLLAPEAAGPEARYSARESVSLAFLTVLQTLPPRPRAVLILRDVLDWPAQEVAGALTMTVPAVKSALHRARAALAQRYTAPAPEPAALIGAAQEALLERYVQAWEAADVNGLVALLRENAVFSMPPIPAWYQGRAAIRTLVARTVFSGPARGRWRLRPTRANGQPAFGLYRRAEAAGEYALYGVQVVTLAGAAVAEILTFRTPALGPHFGLPPALPLD
ncbi:MAG: RNA polymerase subunit sigma-70 [Anaerolineales bacterium]|nr:RNA polymerase subunit sigma-70 [Anaerolineales bacterium]